MVRRAEGISEVITEGCSGSEALHVITSKFPSCLTSQPHSHCSPCLLGLVLALSLWSLLLSLPSESSSSPRTDLLFHGALGYRPAWAASASVFSPVPHSFPLICCVPAALTFLQGFQWAPLSPVSGLSHACSLCLEHSSSSPCT